MLLNQSLFVEEGVVSVGKIKFFELVSANFLINFPWLIGFLIVLS